MHTAGILYAIFSLVIIGCIVAVTVVYVANPCCDKSSESYKVSVAHDHPVSGHTPVRNERQHYHARAKPKYGCSGKTCNLMATRHRQDSHAAQNAAMWARHGYVQDM